MVGSLDMLGSPAAFTRNVTDGVKDFVALPYEGIWHGDWLLVKASITPYYPGPWGFLVGLTAGSSSLVKHVSAGTLTSITNFASSMSRNLDRLSLDMEHQVLNPAHCTLHTAHCTLRTEHCTLHTAHCTPGEE